MCDEREIFDDENHPIPVAGPPGIVVARPLRIDLIGDDILWVPLPEGAPIDRAVPLSGRRPVPIRRRDFVITFWGDAWPVANFATHADRVRHVTRQREICPRTGKLHWQAYIEFHDPQYIEFVKRHLFADMTTHVEIRHMSREIARAYCCKKRTRAPGPASGPFEEGTWAQPGSRTDLSKAKDAIDDGLTMATVFEENFEASTKYVNGLRFYKQLAVQRAGAEERNVSVYYYFGTTGTGKTRAAMAECKTLVDGDATRVFILDQPTEGGKLWWCGYDGGPGIIIDDFASKIPVCTLLRILDRYSYRCETKGGQTYLCCTHIWITSNFSVDEITDCGKPVDPRHRSALMRRITHIQQFLNDGRRITFKGAPPA